MDAWSTLLADYRSSAVAFALFALLHSLGAREPCKELIARVCGGFFVEHFWRLLYCVLSYLALYHVRAETAPSYRSTPPAESS